LQTQHQNQPSRQNKLWNLLRLFLWRPLTAYIIAGLLIFTALVSWALSFSYLAPSLVVFAEILFLSGVSVGLLAFLYSSQKPRIHREAQRYGNTRLLPSKIEGHKSLTKIGVIQPPPWFSVEQLRRLKVDPQQSYITLASALQVLAFSVLLYYAPVPNSTFFTFYLRQYLYIPYVVSFLLIITIFSTINLKVFRPSLFQVLLTFLETIFEIVAFEEASRVTDFPVWLIFMGLAIITEGIIRLNNFHYANNILII